MKKSITPNMLRNAIVNAEKNLEANKDMVNSLNVFPVPDGDTGINMLLTTKSATYYALNETSEHCGKIAGAMSKGALMGARGNSGVILSQILRGFYIGIEDKELLDVKAVRHGFDSAKEVAYKAVMKPTEGTILTVIRYMSSFANSHYKDYDDPVKFIQAIYEEGEVALAKTPDMLPVLREAGVVDSGGKGLLILLRGAIDGLLGKKVEYEIEQVSSAKVEYHVDENIKYGYCTEMVIHTEDRDVDVNELKAKLLELGDSLVCVKVDDIIKVHVHTNHPGLVFELGLERGYLTGIKSDNMRIQNAEARRNHVLQEAEKYKDLEEQTDNKKDGFICVVSGDGLEAIFEELGVDKIVAGGQTMNPSVNDIMEAIDSIHADNIFILPNNSNIILTAQKAAEESDKHVVVIPTKTVPQGISAMLNFDIDLPFDEALEGMKEAIGNVKSGSITYAVRDTNISGKSIKQGDYMGLLNSDIVSSGTSIFDVLEETIKAGKDDMTSVITLYAGEEVGDDEMEEMRSKIEEKFEGIFVEAIRGNQPVYYYLISIE